MAYNYLHTDSDIEARDFSDEVTALTSRVFRPSRAFTSLVLSLNARMAADGCALLEVQVCADNAWSPFFKLALLSPHMCTSFAPQTNLFGEVKIDELVLFRLAQAYRYRVKLYGEAELLLVSTSAAQSAAVYEPSLARALPSGERKITVFPCSQMVQNSPDKHRICSPTSVYMALKSLGFSATLEKVLARVYDQKNDIYGNWLFNVVGASSFGAQAFFRRFTALAELDEFVTPHSLVVASIAFEKGELSGAPQERTGGHLVVVRGWEKGRVLVADPAAATEPDVLRSYDANEFADAWFKHGGASYIVRIK